MTQQFSKLNKIGSSFKKNKFKRANFTIGNNNNNKNDSSTDSEDDYENSIFQPNETIGNMSSQFATDSSSNSEHRSNISG